MKSLLVALFGLIVLAALPAASGPATDSGNAAATIAIDNFSFQEQTVTVAAGTPVTWVNHDDVPHKIVATDKSFSSPVLDTDGRYSHTFTSKGTYEYFCSLHPVMKGKIVVK